VTEGGIEPSEIRAALDEVLAWPGIARSTNLGDVLRYVVEKALAGDEASIKAYSIAVDVLGRPSTFDPQTDPIVRVQARRLRTALEQFYASGASRSAVEIHLPLGRYVPEFRRAERPVAAEEVAETPGETGSSEPKRTRRPMGVASAAAIGLLTTLVGVGLTVALLRWILPPTVSDPNRVNVPIAPTVTVGDFVNLTGDVRLDGTLSAFESALGNDLSKFEALNVVSQTADYRVTGTLRQDAGSYIVRASIIYAPSGMVWTATLWQPKGVSVEDSLERLAADFASRIGAFSSPLYDRARGWLQAQEALPDTVNRFICTAALMDWADSARLDDAQQARSCFLQVLKSDPKEALALAAQTALGSWLRERGDPSGLVSGGADAAMRDSDAAAKLAPNSALVNFLHAFPLRETGRLADAVTAVDTSLSINPGDPSALAYRGYLLWISGQFEAGAEAARKAIGKVNSAPSWYYMVPGFEALRTGDYTTAIENGLMLSDSGSAIGQVLVLGAAPLAGRNELVGRFTPIVLRNPQLQQRGILPVVSALLPQPGLLDQLKNGLTSAGVPQAALTGPFTASIVGP